MDEQLISKKDLLEETDISYGQLYRWKRKDLIPEEWFIRKSTFTGQETFFPRDKILARINKIKELKNELSLDELVEVFSPQSNQQLDKTNLMKCNIVTENTLAIFTKEIGDKELFTFQDILQLYVMEQNLVEGKISLDEARLMFRSLQQDGNSSAALNRVILARKMGVAFVVLAEKEAKVVLDDEAKVILDILMEDWAEAVKKRLFQ